MIIMRLHSFLLGVFKLRLKPIFTFSVCALFLVCIVVFNIPSVSAAEEESGLVPVDLLDYSTMNDTGINYGYLQSSNEFTYWYSCPINFTFWYVDTIFELSYGTAPITSLSSVTCVGRAGTTVPLTFKHLGNGTWRAYGSLTNRFTPINGVGIKVTSSYDRFFCTVDSFNVFTLPGTAVAERGEIQSYVFYGDTSWKAMSYPGETIGGSFYSNLDAAGYYPYTVHASSVNWRNFDYIDFQFRAIISTIDSINVQISKTESTEYVNLPFEVGWVNGTAIGPNTFVNQSGSYPITQLPATSTTQINLRVYIPSEYRTYGSLFIIFNGQYPAESGASHFALDKVTGFYNVHDYDPELVKLDQIRLAIENNLSAPPGSDQIASDTAGVVSGQQNSVSSGLDSLGSIERPDIDIGDFDFSVITSSNGIHLLNVMLNPIKENPIVLGCMFLAAVLGLYAFVFFGKKG